MNSDQAARVPVPRIVGGAVVGIVLGFLLPFIAVMQLSILPLGMIPVLLLGGIFMAWLHGWSGWIPTAAFMLALLLSAADVHPTAMYMCVAGMVLPGIVVITGMIRKRPFFEQMRIALISFMAGLTLAIFIAYRSFGADMIAKLMASIQAQYDQLPDYVIAEMVRYMKQSMGGGVPEGASQLLTVEGFRNVLQSTVLLMQQIYSENVPGALLGGALWSGVLACLWGNWRMAKRGIATSESYVGISGWYLPPYVTAGALGLLVISLIMTLSGGGSGRALWNACSSLSGAAFTVQALASIDRRFKRRGVSTGGRKVRVGFLLALFWLLVPLFGTGLGTLPQYYGAASALFGSRGAVTLLRKKIEEHSDDDHSDF